MNYLSLPPLDVGLHSSSPSFSTAAPPPVCGNIPLAAVYPVPSHCLPVGQTVPRQQSNPLLLPLPFLAYPNTTNPIVPLAPAKPGCFLLQMVWTTPTDSSQHGLEQEPNGRTSQEQVEGAKSSMIPRLKVEERRGEDESSASTSTLSPVSSSGERDEEEEEQQDEVENGDEQEVEVKEEEEERKNSIVMGVVSLNGGESSDGEGGQGTEGGDGGAGEEEEEEGREGEGDQGGEREEAERQRENGGGEREEDGEKEKDEDHDRQGEEEEEEDFDDLTQDEDEEEVMSSASEESVLSVPELQVNRKFR